MVGVSEATIATVVLVAVGLSFPCLCYGAWIVLAAETVTWGVLVSHLRYIAAGLTLTTVPLVAWMVPRMFGVGDYSPQFTGLAVVHALLGAQAYALLVFGLTGIVRIFRAKYEHDLYHDYDESVLLEEIGSERMDHWRSRLRVGVFGYTILWTLAFITGLARYGLEYL